MSKVNQGFKNVPLTVFSISFQEDWKEENQKRRNPFKLNKTIPDESFHNFGALESVAQRSCSTTNNPWSEDFEALTIERARHVSVFFSQFTPVLLSNNEMKKKVRGIFYWYLFQEC